MGFIVSYNSPDGQDILSVTTSTVEYIGNHTGVKGPAIVAGGLGKPAIHIDDIISITVEKD